MWPGNSGKKLQVKRLRLVVLAGLAIIALIAILAFAQIRHQSSEMRLVDNSTYQAVFLTNGQVYFGKVSNVNNQFVDLDQIYYLQTQQTDSENASARLNDADTEVQLIKLGNELHGPQDKMVISKQQVLFWENLKNDSRVVEAIDQFISDSED